MKFRRSRISYHLVSKHYWYPYETPKDEEFLKTYYYILKNKNNKLIKLVQSALTQISHGCELSVKKFKK